MELTPFLCRDKGFWTGLNPHLGVEGGGAWRGGEQAEAPPEELTKAREMLFWDGYFVLPELFSPEEVDELSRAVVELEGQEIPGIFTFVYDEVWELLPRLKEILATVLEPDLRVEANFWLWNVAADDAAAGFKLHRDCYEPRLFPDGQPQAVTLWFALTDAVPPQSCMVYLPASRDPFYVHHLKEPYAPPIEHVRTVPVPRGSVIGHCPNLLHCGSASSRFAEGPRVSFCIEVQSRRLPTSSAPSWPLEVVPTFEERLRWIAMMVEMYQHHSTLPEDLLRLARSLAA